MVLFPTGCDLSGTFHGGYASSVSRHSEKSGCFISLRKRVPEKGLSDLGETQLSYGP